MKKDSKRTGKGDKILLVAGFVFLVMFCVAGVMLLKYYGEYQKQQELSDDMAMLRQADLEERENDATDGTDDATADWQTDIDLELQRNNSRLAELNPDYVGWITIPDTKIYYPMVQRDNSHYLYYDFMDEKDSHGTIFLDENCETADDVLLIHGHHMKDGTMFAALKGYKEKTFRKEHPSLYLDFGMGDIEYEIFAVALVDLTVEGYFSYDKLPQNDEEKARYLQQLKQNSLWYEAPEDESKQIVLLSTCEYGTDEQRLVVAAVAK